MNDRTEVSVQEVRVARALQERRDRWSTPEQLYAELEGRVSPRTVRLHTRRLAEAGLVEVREVFPAWLYRWAPDAERHGAQQLARIRAAEEAFASAGVA